MKQGVRKFIPPLREDLGEDVMLSVRTARDDGRGGTIITVEAWNGDLLNTHEVNLTHEAKRLRFAQALVAQVPTLVEDQLARRLLVLERRVRQVLDEPEEPEAESGSSGGRRRPSLMTERLADVLQQESHFAQDAAGRLFVYRDGVYRPEGEATVRRRVKVLLADWGEGWSSHRAREVAEFLRVDIPLLWERPPLDRINLANGLYEIATGKLLSPTPEFLTPVQIPIRFDPTADCLAWRGFIGEVFPEDAGAVAWELLAELLAPDPSFQRALLFTGDGANGKSTFLAAVVAFLGRANVATLTLQRLEADRFAVARLLGKLANVCPDLPAAHLQSSAMFKAITGGDAVTGEFKHRDSFDFAPFARLLFSANAPPRSADASPAFFRRWLVVPFTRTFEGAQAKPRRELDAALSDPRELSGALNEALGRLQGVRQNGLSESDTMRAAWQELRETTDPLAVWLDRVTEADSEAHTPRRELWQAYRRDCLAAGRPTLSENAFGRALRPLRPDLKESYPTVGTHRREHCWAGIRLRKQQEPAAAE